jgi:hypothetical protein
MWQKGNRPEPIDPYRSGASKCPQGQVRSRMALHGPGPPGWSGGATCGGRTSRGWRSTDPDPQGGPGPPRVEAGPPSEGAPRTRTPGWSGGATCGGRTSLGRRSTDPDPQGGPGAPRVEAGPPPPLARWDYLVAIHLCTNGLLRFL